MIARRLKGILPLAVLMVLLGALVIRLAQHQTAPSHPVAVSANNQSQSYAVPHPIPTLRPRHMTPLLQKEVALLSYCPANQQLAWVTIGRPPLYYSPQDNVYYFGQRYHGSVFLTPNFSAYNPPATLAWYGQPLKP